MIRCSLFRPAAAVLAAGLLCAALPAAAQERLQPARGLAAAPAAGKSETQRRLVGTWGISRSDKDTTETETTLIELRADGTYATRLRSSLFKEQEQLPLATGRWSVDDDDGKAFTLAVAPNPGDPDGGKDTAPIRTRVVFVDDNTLRAEDGSVVQRTR